MNYNDKRTLSYYDSTPQVQLFNLRHIRVKDFAINCKALYEQQGGDNKQVSPDAEALAFYALNHLASLVRKKFTKHEVLPEWALSVMQAYQTCLRKQGSRMLNYMTLITTRESRHAKDKQIGSSTFKAEFELKFGTVMGGFKKGMPHGSGAAAEYFMDSPPDVDLGRYCDSLPFTFYKAQFSGGYGGKPWGMIADTLASFISGKTSMEMLLDTAYTLAHNNGPMFNKGMMYHMYDTGHDGIYKILDVQRSGQVPELVMAQGVDEEYIYPEVKKLVHTVVGLFPGEFGEEVDWHKVEALGSLKKYPNEKKKQKNVPPPEPPKPVMKDGKLVIGQYVVAPGMAADIIQRNAVTA